MINFAGIILYESIESIVRRLRQDLHDSGRMILQDIKPSGDNIMVSCPNHSDGLEKKASCGISLQKKRTADGRTIEAGTVHCFSCGFKANFAEFISRCFQMNDAGQRGVQWLFENYAELEQGERPALNLDLDRTTKPPEYVSEETLEKFRYTHPYMKKRKLNWGIVDDFDVGFDAETDCLTFPVKDMTGGVLFVQRRAVGGKQFKNEVNASKGVVIYGLYEATKAKASELFVCESIIDALTIWGIGKPAVALMGAMPTETQIQLLASSGARSIILALDNDEAGIRGRRMLKSRLSSSKLIFDLKMPSGVKDVNELTEEQLEGIEGMIQKIF